MNQDDNMTVNVAFEFFKSKFGWKILNVHWNMAKICVGVVGLNIAYYSKRFAKRENENSVNECTAIITKNIFWISYEKLYYIEFENISSLCPVIAYVYDNIPVSILIHRFRLL